MVSKYKNINDRKREWQENNRWYLKDLYKRRKIKIDLIKLTNGCMICGFKAFPEALEFHHIDPTKKKFVLGAENHGRSWLLLIKEMQKCVVLCSNCHVGVTVGRLVLPTTKIVLQPSIEAYTSYTFKQQRRNNSKKVDKTQQFFSDF